MSVSNNNLFEFQLENNPIDSQLVLLSNTNTKANISIIDVTGKIVFNTTMALNNRSLIPVNLASGFYILNITSDNNASFVTKFLAK